MTLTECLTWLRVNSLFRDDIVREARSLHYVVSRDGVCGSGTALTG